MPPTVTTRPARLEDFAAISTLHAKTLGPGRYARSAYRVREGTPGVSKYCRVCFSGSRMVAALRMTEVTIATVAGALLLGPLAVDPEFAGQGYGRQMVTETLDVARKHGVELVVLVGDESYYGRFGFKPVPTGQIRLPGPVDPRRLLAVELAPGALAHFRGVVEAAF